MSPLSFYDPQGDFSADSAPSRGSPISPVFGNPFQLPLDSDWPAYLDKPDMSPDLDVFYGESFGGPMAFMTSQNPTLSPTANPLDLVSDSVPFGDDFIDAQPLFQTAGGFSQPTTTPSMAPTNPQQTKRLAQRPASPKLPARATRSSQRQQMPSRSSDLKRKSSSSDSGSSRSTSPEPPARRTKHSDPSKNPHNLIEKRYRVNINEKILALRDAVPALRCVVQQQSGENPEAEEADTVPAEELGGLMPARKLNKATILSKATEYIGHLEKKNDLLAKENRDLERKLADVQRWQRSQIESGAYWA